MLQDVGIPVHERAPETDDAMFGESTEAADEVAEEEAAAYWLQLKVSLVVPLTLFVCICVKWVQLNFYA
jgi:hypothetical protein